MKATSAVIGVLALLSPGLAGAQAIPVPSVWQGAAISQVGGRRYQTSCVITIEKALPYERNPFHLSVQVGSPTQVGGAAMFSAMTSRAPVQFQFETADGLGNNVVLPCMRVELAGGQFRATLIDTQERLGLNIMNSFVAPPVTAQNAPPAMGSAYGFMTSEPMTFQAGATVAARLRNGRLEGALSGIGRSIIAIYTTPSLRYDAAFVLQRVR